MSLFHQSGAARTPGIEGMMLTAEGCRQRRQRLWRDLGERLPADRLLFDDPVHLMYLANFYVDPFSLGFDYGGILEVRRDGRCTLWHENRLPESVKAACVDEARVVTWYDGQSPAAVPRRLALSRAIAPDGDFRLHDRIGDPWAETVITTLARMRRQKDADEIALLKRCARAAEAGFRWARQHLAAGMTEFDVYLGVQAACARSAGQAVIVYGDFAVSPGPARRGGPPTQRLLADGDLFILDYSVVIGGYRCDFTNTFVVGGKPRPEQQRLFELCRSAMRAGEQLLRAGTTCQSIDDAVRGTLAAAGMESHFGHHSGHGLGLSHPEAPFLVRHSTESLLEGDVITLEPGLYVEGVGGIRIEHNYLITAEGFERLSQHEIAL
jgi:Xaa-Pro aminopeptidase